MVKEPAGALIITTPTELLNSEMGDFDMTIRPARQVLWLTGAFWDLLEANLLRPAPHR
jgi:hypothetical protein